MKLSVKQRNLLKVLMTSSAKKGNLANSGIVIQKGKVILSSESLVVSDCNATAHSERILVEKAGEMFRTNILSNLSIITVVEPCVMCMSACSQATLSEIYYIIPANKYYKEIPWMTDTITTDKKKLGSQFTNPISLIHLKEYEDEFCKVFEKVMKVAQDEF